MIELRWVQKQVVINTYPDGDSLSQLQKVLQYRARYNDFFGAEWSEWQDVPIVVEGEE